MLEKQLSQLIVISGFSIFMAFILLISGVDNQKKKIILYLSIVLSISYFIPFFKLSLLKFNEFIILILAIYLFIEQKSYINNHFILLFLLLVIFSFISLLLNKEIQYWLQFFVLPLAIFYIFQNLRLNQDESKRIIKVILLMINLIFIIYVISFFYGSVESVASFGVIQSQEKNLSLLGYGARRVSLGPFVIELGHNMIASLASIIVVTSTALFFYSSKSSVEKIFYITEVILGIIVLFMTSSRGNFVTAGISMLFIFFVSIKKNRFIWTFSFLFFFIIIYLNSDIILSLITEQELKRWLELLSLSNRIDTFNYRIDFLNYTFFNIFSNFWGLGFNYYYFKNIDDAMLISFLLNGVGIITTIIFFSLIVTLFIKFLSSLNKNKNIFNVLGISLILMIILSGFSQTYLVGWAFYSILIWILLAVSFFNFEQKIFYKGISYDN